MRDVVVVEAVRSPLGRRGGALSALHPADLLGTVQRACLERAGIEPTEVDQVLGGCVTQVGEQSFNIARVAWLGAGLPLSVAATTLDSQCGSSQQATNLGAALVASGAADVVVACGVEVMSRVPFGANITPAAGDRTRMPPSAIGEALRRWVLSERYVSHYEPTSQFDGAERIAEKWGIARKEADAFGLESQARARNAVARGYFDREITTITVPEIDDAGTTGRTSEFSRDEVPRETSGEALAALRPVAGDGGIHTAGTSSQISDGAAAVLLMSAEKAAALGLRRRARITQSCLVGVDPVLILTGPIDATRMVLDRSGMAMKDVDVVEINEAFAAVVLAWAKEFKPDMERVNPNGGAIALGHPLGASGARLITTALHELERRGAATALVTMCCGGGLGTGTLLERC